MLLSASLCNKPKHPKNKGKIDLMPYDISNDCSNEGPEGNFM